MAVAAVVPGLVLGVFYGWVAAQTLLGSLGHPRRPVLPPPTIVIVVVGHSSSRSPPRRPGPSRHTRLADEALAVD